MKQEKPENPKQIIFHMRTEIKYDLDVTNTFEHLGIVNDALKSLEELLKGLGTVGNIRIFNGVIDPESEEQ